MIISKVQSQVRALPKEKMRITELIEIKGSIQNAIKDNDYY